MILYVDDLPWAGTDTLAVLVHIAELMQGKSRVLLVLGVRDAEKVREPAALDALRERLSAQVGARVVKLEPLGEEAVLAIVQQLFHHSVPHLRLAHVLWQRSRGNPGLIVEMLRGLIARGDARPHDASARDVDTALDLVVSPDELPLPGSLRKAIAESYRALPAPDRTWLRRLAVVGGRIEADFLMRAFPGHRRGDVDAMLSRLARSGWLSATGARWRFSRPALREAVYRSLSKEQRIKLHAAAAAALVPQENEREPTVEESFQRAFHLRSAGDHGALLAVLPPLLRRLLSSGQPQRVHSLSQWGLDAIAALPRSKEHDRLRIDLLEAAADAADRLGMRAGQRAVLDRLTDLDFDPDVDPEAIGRVYLLHGRYAVSTGQYGLARGMLRNAVELFARAEADALRCEALRRLSLVQSHVGELDDARKLAREALTYARNPGQEALSFLALGVIEVLDDEFEEALQHTDAALATLRANRSSALPGVLAAAHMLRARIHRSSGAPARALASASRAVQLARSAGERGLEADATARLGGLLLDLDRVQESEARLREALLLATEIEDRRGQALARLFLGILLWELDDPEADAMLQRAADLAVEMGLNRVEALAAGIRARIFRQSGDVEAALEWSARALSLVDKFGAELADRIAITGTRALVLSTANDEAAAQSLESKLREKLRRENARIRSPLMRLRHKRASERLLEAVLSPEGPVYPRISPERTADEG
jgi:tetratricopeptide (TPR) repeat protein